MTTLISLLSDQTLPNVLFIEAVKTTVETYIFMSTRRMEREKKMDIIINTCQLTEAQCKSIEVEPEHYDAIIKSLEAESWNQTSQYLIHITGGTKMMALAVKDFFKPLPQSDVYYIPIGHQKAYSLTHNDKSIQLPQIHLNQYLSAHGYSFIHNNRPEQDHTTAHRLFEKVLTKGHPAKVDEIMHRVKPEYGEKDKRWYSGEWFEEWLYEKMKAILKIPDDDIAMKVKIKSHRSETATESDNEFDVMFVKNNKLYIVEAKVYSRFRLSATFITSPMYKIASQQTVLGLHAHSIVVILSPLWENKSRTQRINDLKRVLRIHQVWDLHDLRDYIRLIEYLI